MDSKIPSDQARRERHAFVVDDVPQLRASVSYALRSAGFVPHEFGDASGLEAALAVFAPDVIVLDLSLGKADGVDLMGRLATLRFAGKVLLVSGHDLATLEEAQKVGEGRGLAMLPSLRKPVRLAELKARLALVGEPPLSSAACRC